MGRYDDITGEELQNRLLKFARLVRAMEKQDVLLEKAPSLLRLLGELRQMIFAYEVRSTREFESSGEGPGSGSGGATAADADPLVEDSLRIVREALERDQELQRELRDDFVDDDEGD